MTVCAEFHNLTKQIIGFTGRCLYFVSVFFFFPEFSKMLEIKFFFLVVMFKLFFLFLIKI